MTEISKRKKTFALVLIILTAANLRAPITCIGSLVSTISENLGLSPSAAGFVTTIPLLAFGVLSPATVYISRRLGVSRTMLLSFGVLSLGIVIRSYCGMVGIFAGTVIIGASIAMGNVMLPAIIKSCFPEKINKMTSLYTVIMQVVSTVSTGISVPIAICCGWKNAIAIWLLPAVLTAVLCIKDRGITITEGKSKEGGGRAIIRRGISWWVSLYMGAQSLIFYTFIAWLSPMLQDRGYGEVFSGYMLSIFVLMGMAGSAALPIIMRINKNQMATGMEIGGAYLVGTLALLCNVQSLSVAGVLLCGFCSGISISYAMSLFGYHTENGDEASKLSAMAQSIGYLLAAVGPLVVGKLYSMTGGWNVPMGVVIICAIFLIVAGAKVGKRE